MKNTLKKLRQQNELLSLAIQVIEWNTIVKGDDFEVTNEVIKRQGDLIQEEIKELAQAVKDNDLIEWYDALADIFFVRIFGLAITDLNILKDINEMTDGSVDSDVNLDCLIDCIKEVTRSNWTKFANYELTSNEFNVVKRGGLWLLFDENGKVRKPECYEKPNLKPILIKHGIINE